MNRRLINLIFVLFAVIVLNNSTQAQQLGSHYFWANEISVGTTAVDSIFKLPWEYASVYADTIDIYLKIGAPDTTSWSSRVWIFLPKGSSIEFSPFIKLRRLSVKAAYGSGKVYIVGFKKKPQY